MQDSDGNFILSNELLFKILGYVGKDRKHAKLVCKHFYCLIIDLEKHHKKLILNAKVLESESSCNMIINSPRKFTKMNLDLDKLTFEAYHRLKRICMAIGSNVTELKWKCNKMTIVEYRILLSYFPNLEKLTCINFCALKNAFADHMKKVQLKNLKSLSLNCANEASARLFNDNFLEQNTIDELEVSERFVTKIIFQNQQNIKKLKINHGLFDANDLLNFDLQELALTNYSSFQVELFEKMLAKQSNITSLDVLEIYNDIRPQAFINIFKLKLTSLRINIDKVDAVVLKEHFWRLKDLLNLTVRADQNRAILLDMKFPKLEYLKLLIFSRIDISNLQNNLPALKGIEVHYANIKFNEALRYPNIEKLNLRSSGVNESAFHKIMCSFPNLRYLNLDMEFTLNLKLLDDILTNLPHLYFLKRLSFVQGETKDEKFNEKSARKLVKFVKEIPTVCMNLQLTTIDIKLSKLKEILQIYFTVKKSKGIYEIHTGCSFED